MKKWKGVALAATVIMTINTSAHAQGVAESLHGLAPVLDNIYDKMMPLCAKLTDVGRGIAGFAALWYIANKVWRSLANAEPIDFYPLFRPFCLGFCIAFFPLVIDLMNGIMKPTVTATSDMIQGTNADIKVLLAAKEEVIKKTDAYGMYVGDSGLGNYLKWLKYTNGIKDDETISADAALKGLSGGSALQFVQEKIKYQVKNEIKLWLSEILQILYEAAALCINTIRTFQLVILAILGPIVFAMACFDGLQHTLTAWLAKYINIFLWLPVCNILSAMLGQIQAEMLKLDVSQVQQAGNTFFSPTDIGFIVFMIMGIVSYMTVPSIAGYIVQAGGGGALTQKVSNMTTGAASGGVAQIAQLGSKLVL